MKPWRIPNASDDAVVRANLPPKSFCNQTETFLCDNGALMDTPNWIACGKPTSPQSKNRSRRFVSKRLVTNYPTAVSGKFSMNANLAKEVFR